MSHKLALSTVAVASLFSLQAFAADDSAVSSESVAEMMAPPASASMRGVSGSKGGSPKAGARLDGAANMPARAESASEVWDLVSKKPMTAPDGVESIIGADQRYLNTNTTTYPNRAVVLITFESSRCTGWMINHNTVATAGHCVHSGGSSGRWYNRTTYRIYPGRNGASSPYGSCTAKSLHSVSGWTSSRNTNYDYGAIKLNCSVGNTVGWFGFWWQSASLTGTSTTITGYPGDKPLTQWRSYDYVRYTASDKIYYQNDTVGGMSGSPVYKYRSAGSPYCVGYCSMAVHTNGVGGSYPSSVNNAGTRITQAKFNNLIYWRNLP